MRRTQKTQPIRDYSVSCDPLRVMGTWTGCAAFSDTFSAFLALASAILYWDEILMLRLRYLVRIQSIALSRPLSNVLRSLFCLLSSDAISSDCDCSSLRSSASSLASFCLRYASSSRRTCASHLSFIKWASSNLHMRAAFFSLCLMLSTLGEYLGRCGLSTSNAPLYVCAAGGGRDKQSDAARMLQKAKALRLCCCAAGKSQLTLPSRFCLGALPEATRPRPKPWCQNPVACPPTPSRIGQVWRRVLLSEMFASQRGQGSGAPVVSCAPSAEDRASPFRPGLPPHSRTLPRVAHVAAPVSGCVKAIEGSEAVFARRQPRTRAYSVFERRCSSSGSTASISTDREDLARTRNEALTIPTGYPRPSSMTGAPLALCNQPNLTPDGEARRRRVVRFTRWLSPS